MKTCEINYRPFSIPLRIPLELGGRKNTHRRGFILSITDEDGVTGYGECAPLLGGGFHRETWEQVETALRELRGNPRAPVSYPSLQFAMDQAWLHLELNKAGTGVGATGQVSICGLILNHELALDRVTPLVEWLEQNQFTSIKIKIGRQDLEKECRVLEKLCTRTRGQVQFRLDGNRLLGPQDLAWLENRLQGFPIEYLEEPWRNWEEFLAAPRSTPHGLPYAMDEMIIQDRDFLDRIPEFISTIILKPTTLGSWHRTRQWMDRLGLQGKKVVISSTFDTYPTPLTLAYISQMSSMTSKSSMSLISPNTKTPQVAQGLGTLRFMDWNPIGPYEHSLLTGKLELQEGWWNEFTKFTDNY